MNAVRAFLLGLLLSAGTVSFAEADWMNPGSGLLIRTDWQLPEQLPPRFRNHCSWDTWSSRPYCSNHCGVDYQFFSCSPGSFGCCHLGHGYCDWTGHLRCAP